MNRISTGEARLFAFGRLGQINLQDLADCISAAAFQRSPLHERENSVLCGQFCTPLSEVDP